MAVTIIVASLPFTTMLALVLPSNPIVGIFMLILELFMKLTVFPRAQALFVGCVMFFSELIVNIIVPLCEPLVLPVVLVLPNGVMRQRRNG